MIFIILYFYIIYQVLKRFDKILGSFNFIFFFTLFHTVYTIMIPLELMAIEANRFSLMSSLQPKKYILWSFFAYIGFIIPFLCVSKKLLGRFNFYLEEKLLSFVRKFNIFTFLYLCLGLLLFRESIFQAGSYGGNITLSENSFYKYYINTGIIMLALIISVYTKNNHKIIPGCILLFMLFWSLYSSDKNPIVIGGLGLLFGLNNYRFSSFKWLIVFIIIIPIFSIGFSSYRAGGLNLFSISRSLYSNSDPKGPFLTVIEANSDYLKDADLKWGESYLNSVFAWVPKFIWRNRPDDLGILFAKKHISSYSKGLGFGYSPLAEGVVNFGFFGPFIHYLMVSLILTVLIKYYSSLPNKKQNIKFVFYFFVIYYVTMMHRTAFTLPADLVRVLIPLVLMVKLTTIRFKHEHPSRIPHKRSKKWSIKVDEKSN